MRKNRRENGSGFKFGEDFYEKMDFTGYDFVAKPKIEQNLINVIRCSVLLW